MHDVDANSPDEASARTPERASEQLVQLLYGELRRLARARLSRERAGHTLQTTALIHEAWLRLADGNTVEWNSQGHFFAAAARAMRHVLVDHARQVSADKRGGGWERLEFQEALIGLTLDVDVTLDLDAALERLEASNARLAEVALLRFYAGLTVEEAAQALDLSPRSVKRDWTLARAWLRRELTAGSPAGDTPDPQR